MIQMRIALRLQRKSSKALLPHPFHLSSDGDSDSWFTFTGNHIGVLLASNLFDSIKDDENKRIAVLNSAVSTGMLEKMALAKGLHFEETLTGFKVDGKHSPEA
jgi:Phosphomannomutase